MKSLEDEIREIHQRLERIERAVKIDDYNGVPISKNGHFKRITAISTEIINNIESTKLKHEKDPLKVLNIPEISAKIDEIKIALIQLDN